MRVDHSGNTCSVGYTCIYVYDVTEDDLDELMNVGCKIRKQSFIKRGQGYIDIHIQEWDNVYAYLTMIGVEVSKFPRGIEMLGDKWRQWVAYGYPEIKQFVTTNGD